MTWQAARNNRILKLGMLAAGVVLGAVWGSAHWETALQFIYQPDTSTTDPILHRTTGFYLFGLPFFSALQGFMLLLAIVGTGGVLSTYFHFDTQRGRIAPRRADTPQHRWSWLNFNAAVLFAVLSVGLWLSRYELMYAESGIVTGPGWVDARVRLPALTAMALVLLILAAGMLLPPLQRAAKAMVHRLIPAYAPGMSELGLPVAAAVVAAVLGGMGLGIVPGLFQSFLVEPNEITMERPYIANNIKFTRKGFGLDNVQEREFPVTDEKPPRLSQGQGLYGNIRLWDWRALDAVYQQFQEIRLYYEFTDVDVDRYRINGDYRQMMISAREMEVSNLPDDSQTFVNRRFKYTHGYGITLTDVSQFTPDGLPDLLIKDIPPKSRYRELQVDQPRIYYGELSDDYVVVNSREKEFDHPSGEENVYYSYTGKGGVPVTSMWRKFIYGYKFGGIKFFLSGYPTAQSRIMFHRQIRKRISQLAHFLTIDGDPYVVLSGGRLYWIVDAYTTTSFYPYSSSIGRARVEETTMTSARQDAMAGRLSRANYMRNSVKVVVDAYQGTVDLYVFEPDDPLIQVWGNIYPGLMKPSDQMPDELKRHIRYPADMLLIQGLIYSKYHMTDPMVFYNQEDLWIRATEKYYNYVQPVSPYYIMWQPPGQQALQFVLMQPFTPKNRQVMIGWIAGMCDGENYGRLLAYKFPKDKRVLGTQQVETKIDQDSFLSSQLSLWDQRGSKVIRGNVLAIPIEKTMLYVEPIYLQADTAAYPELRLVAVMHQDRLSYAENFDDALAGLFDAQERQAMAVPGRIGQSEPERASRQSRQLVRQASAAFDAYLKALGERRFDTAARSLSDLEKILGELSNRFEDTVAGEVQEAREK